MNYQELKNRFENGEQIIVRFHPKKMKITIGGDTVRDIQLSKIRNEFKNNIEFENDFGGITTHFYKFKKD